MIGGALGWVCPTTMPKALRVQAFGLSFSGFGRHFQALVWHGQLVPELMLDFLVCFNCVCFVVLVQLEMQISWWAAFCEPRSALWKARSPDLNIQVLCQMAKAWWLTENVLCWSMVCFLL